MLLLGVGITLLITLAAIAAENPGSHESPATGYTIPDFTCSYDGQMVSGFKNGKPVCSTPAGFITPNLACGDIAEEPTVLVGIKDGHAVCKAVHIDWDQTIQGDVYASGEAIHIRLYYNPPPPTTQ